MRADAADCRKRQRIAGNRRAGCRVDPAVVRRQGDVVAVVRGNAALAGDQAAADRRHVADREAAVIIEYEIAADNAIARLAGDGGDAVVGGQVDVAVGIDRQALRADGAAGRLVHIAAGGTEADVAAGGHDRIGQIDAAGILQPDIARSGSNPVLLADEAGVRHRHRADHHGADVVVDDEVAAGNPGNHADGIG